MKQEKVVLVNKHNKKIGVEEKMKAHVDAKLHRAFSIFVFDLEGRILLQQRAKSKYHCGGMWANTCCSHPRPNETYFKATHRRLVEEMGFVCPLKKAFCFIYKEKFDNGLTEHEYDCVFIGTIKPGTKIKPNPKEVEDYKWVYPKDLEKDIQKNPKKYTVWLKIAFKELMKREK
ncbi:MAG: isopentenyl-diphosphate Delta-isomerase [Candidatus Nanoarchaeia archaeon]